MQGFPKCLSHKPCFVPVVLSSPSTLGQGVRRGDCIYGERICRLADLNNLLSMLLAVATAGKRRAVYGSREGLMTSEISTQRRFCHSMEQLSPLNLTVRRCLQFCLPSESSVPRHCF